MRFGLMFVYLWVVFGLFVLHERIIRGQMGLGFQAQGFALINALVLAKVMLVAEDLRLDRGLRGQPLAYAAAGEAALFAIVFIVFHVLERLWAVAHCFHTENSAEEATSARSCSVKQSATQFFTVSCTARYSSVADDTALGGTRPCSCHSAHPSISHCSI